LMALRVTSADVIPRFGGGWPALPLGDSGQSPGKAGRGDESIQRRALPGGVGLIERAGPAHPELVVGVLLVPGGSGVAEDERAIVRLAGTKPEIVEVADEDPLAAAVRRMSGSSGAAGAGYALAVAVRFLVVCPGWRLGGGWSADGGSAAG
jgi:hypothetical protein